MIRYDIERNGIGLGLTALAVSPLVMRDRSSVRTMPKEMKLWLVTESEFYNFGSTLDQNEMLMIVRAPTEAEAIAMAEMPQGIVRRCGSFRATELNPDGNTEMIYSVRGWEYFED